MKIVIESPEKLTDSDLEEMLTCGKELVDGLLCKLLLRPLFHYICILSQLMHLVKHLSTSIMNSNNIVSKKGGGGGGGRFHCPLNYTLIVDKLVP